MLEDKTAIITGASRGLGLATAKALHASGANIVITGRDQKTLDRAAAGLTGASGAVLTVRGDALRPS